VFLTPSMTSPTIQDQETTGKRTLYQRDRLAANKVKASETARKARNVAYQKKAKEKKRVLNVTMNTPTAPMANLDDGVSSNAAIIESMMAALNGVAKLRIEALLLQANFGSQNIQGIVKEAVTSGVTTGVAAGLEVGRTLAEGIFKIADSLESQVATNKTADLLESPASRDDANGNH
jgi:hypothetical protein